MRRMRAIGLWVTLAAVGVLVALSVVGTFRGAEGARALFTSEPLAVFWILLAAFLVACFFFGTGLLRSPGLVAMHVGSILVLVGAMWGSDKGHSVAEKLLGGKKIPHGYMMIPEGAVTDEVADEATGEPVGRLPFRVGLKDFRIEYYPAKGPWELWFEMLVPPGHAPQMGWVQVEWKEGEEVSVGRTALRVRVVKYLPGARAVRDEAGEIAGAAPDAESPTPAMEVEVAVRDQAFRGWILVLQGEDRASLSLAPIMPKDLSKEAAPNLWLVQPRGMPKDYFSDLTVLEGGSVAAEKTIEVNDPLGWGGYHFYQYDYDHERGEYTVLSVRSDSGLYAVYAGFVLLVAGTFVRFWFERARTGWRRRRNDGVQADAR
jgi:hypothetical protein